MKVKTKSPKNVTAAVIAVQFICVFILVAGVLCVKYFAPKSLRKISGFFKNTLCQQTDPVELLALFEDEV